MEPSAVPRSTAGQARSKSSRVGQSRVIFCAANERVSRGCVKLVMISPMPKTPMASVATSIPSVSSVMPKVKRVPPVLPSVPTRPNSRPSTIMAIALTTEPWASTTAVMRPSTISEKYSGAPNDWPTLASGGANVAMSVVETQPAKNEASAATASAGAALSRHLVAVDAGDNRRGLARQVHQDGRGRAAILRAIEDAREHDQARCRLEMEGQRQQHRDGRDRADTGENADQCPDQRAGKREEKIRRRQRHAESDREIVQKLHLPLRPDRDGQSQSEDEDAPGENNQHESRRERLERPQPARRDRAHADQQQNRNHEPKPLDAEPEDHQACGDENDRSQCRDVARRQRPRILGFAQSLHENDDAKAEQEPAQQPRHVAGTHAQGGSDGIIARQPQAGRRHGDEEQARQHVLAREHAPEPMGRVALFLSEAQPPLPFPSSTRASGHPVNTECSERPNRATPYFGGYWIIRFRG